MSGFPMRLLAQGYAVATAGAVILVALGASFWVGLLCAWLGGGVAVLVIAALSPAEAAATSGVVCDLVGDDLAQWEEDRHADRRPPERDRDVG